MAATTINNLPQKGNFAIWKTKDDQFYLLVRGAQGDWFKLPMTLLTQLEMDERLVK